MRPRPAIRPRRIPVSVGMEKSCPPTRRSCCLLTHRSPVLAAAMAEPMEDIRHYQAVRARRFAWLCSARANEASRDYRACRRRVAPRGSEALSGALAAALRRVVSAGMLGPYGGPGPAMGDSRIAWTDKTWNPSVVGCAALSPGCHRVLRGPGGVLEPDPAVATVAGAGTAGPRTHRASTRRADPLWGAAMRVGGVSLLRRPCRGRLDRAVHAGRPACRAGRRSRCRGR